MLDPAADRSAGGEPAWERVFLFLWPPCWSLEPVFQRQGSDHREEGAAMVSSYEVKSNISWPLGFNPLVSEGFPLPLPHPVRADPADSSGGPQPGGFLEHLYWAGAVPNTKETKAGETQPLPSES